MLEFIAYSAAAVAGAIYLLAPLVIHKEFRFAARCEPKPIDLDRLPRTISVEFRERIIELSDLGFDLVGALDCAVLRSETPSYMACFSNRRTNECANVTALETSEGPASYFEFSSRFSNGRGIETNTNGILPLLPMSPDIAVFRFASVEQPRTLLRFIGSSWRNTHLACTHQATRVKRRFSVTRE